MFAQIEKAYQTLADPVKRAAYDAELLREGQQTIVAKDTSGQRERPKKVRTAVTILYITLGIGIARAVIEAATNAELAGVGFLMFVTLTVFAFMVFLFIMIGRGRNWARITFLVLFLLGLLPSIFPLIRSFALSPVSGVLGSAQVLLQIVALVLLFRQESSAWFKGKPAAT